MLTSDIPQIQNLVQAPQNERTGPWMNVVTHLDPKYGGISAVVPELCEALTQARGASARLDAFCLPDEDHRPHSGVRTSIWPSSRVAWLTDRSLPGRFRSEVRRCEGLHIHGLWEHGTMVASRSARSLGKPYILSAHGMLEPWALGNKRLKKFLYASLVERRNVQGAACLQALTHAEAQNYRAFGARQPIAIIPNAIAVPKQATPDAFLSRFPELRGKRLLLFLGRIHFKKGLDLLVSSWAMLAKRWPEAHLVIAGADFEGTQQLIEKMVMEHGIADQVLFTGLLRDEMKWSALAAAGCFLLPSYSEGLSTAVLEAMGMGLPVIVTRQCNLPEVEQYQTGWQIESNIGQLTSSIKEFLAGTSQSAADMGDRGRRLVHDVYNWPSVASKVSDLYQWVAGGPKPHSFDLVTSST